MEAVFEISDVVEGRGTSHADIENPGGREEDGGSQTQRRAGGALGEGYGVQATESRRAPSK